MCGARIKELREREGITQEQLAARMQVEGVQINQKGISRIEAGERVIADYELMVFSRVLKTCPDWFLYGDPM